MVVASKPTSELFRSLAEIGTTLLVAYAVVVSWLVRASRNRPSEERENRLGTFLGAGASSLVGIGLAIVLSERVSSNNWSGLDQIAFGWVIGSLVFLGISIVMQPWVVHEWADEEPRE